MQLVTMGSSKAKSMVHQRKKPSKLMWTQSWRRLNKKGKDDGVAKKRCVAAAVSQPTISNHWWLCISFTERERLLRSRELSLVSLLRRYYICVVLAARYVIHSVGIVYLQIKKKRAVVRPKVVASDAAVKEVKDKKKANKSVAPKGGASIPKNQKGASSAPAKNIGQKR